METNTYNAFISYKQSSDIKTAKALVRHLEHFPIPSKFQKKIGQKRFKIFRDKDELRTNSNLGAELKEALKNSEYLIVICSPTAKIAPSVLKEIRYFMQTHGNSKENIITVLAKGEPADAIPDILMENKHTENQIEPLAADYRKWLYKRKELPRIAARLVDCKYDELIQRYKVYQRVIAIIIAIVAIALAILFTKNIIYHQNILQEESKNLALLSENLYNHHDKEKAVYTALKALRSKENKRPYVPEAKRALLTALDAYKIKEDEIGVIKNFNLHAPIQEYAIYAEGEGKYIAILSKDLSLYAYNIKTGEEVLNVTPVWQESGRSVDSHIVMCDENQLLFCCSTNISSFDLDQKNKLTWSKNLHIDSSFQYVNLSYNSDTITVGLKSGEIILLDKKSGEQVDSIILTDIITKTEIDKQIFAKISPDSRYIICRNKSCINLYDRNEKTLFSISNDLQSEYEQSDEQFIGNYYIFACVNGEKKDIHILCYDMVDKKVTYKKEQQQKERNMYTPRLIPFENVIINGKVMDITLSVIGNSMLLIDCQSDKIMTEIKFTNQIKGAFLQKYKSNSSKHDYGILSLGCDEDVLTVVFENGECADYSFHDKTISESYKVFESGVIYLEKKEDYFLVSYKNDLDEVSKDNSVYELTFNLHTLKNEFYADGILVYGKIQANTDWKKITNDYDNMSSAYPYKNGFLIFQTKSCIYYDVKKGSVIWENPNINHLNKTNIQLTYDNGFWMQTESTYNYLGTDVSGRNILIGDFSEDFSYKIQSLDGENGKTDRIDEINLEAMNNTPYKIQEINDFQNSNGKIYFTVKLEGIHGLIISYDLNSKKYISREIELKNASSSIKISSVSHNGQYILWSEQKKDTLYLDECIQAAILDIKNEKLYLTPENISKNIMLIPTPCWSDNDERFALRSNDQILILTKTGKLEYTIKTKEYIFVGYVFVDDILYVIGELSGIPMLYQYVAQTGELKDCSELKGRNGFCGNTFDIECIKTFDSEIIMILHHNRLLNGLNWSFSVGVPFNNAYIIDQDTGKSIAFVQQGVAYNSNIDYLFANQGIIKRYTTEELIKKASEMK